jgi:hypothetical protein
MEPLPQKPSRFLRPLPRRQLQPVPRLLRLAVLAQSRVFQLRPPVTGAGSLAQQFMANTPVTGIAAITAQHLPQPALRHYHTLTCWLFQQTPGQVLDLRLVTQARVIEQPQGHFEGKPFGGRRRRGCCGAGEGFTAKLHEQQVWQLERRATLPFFLHLGLSISGGLKKFSMIFS